MSLLTPTAIINAACAEIGEDPIQDLDVDTFGGEAASSIYETVVDFNLGITPFSFANEYRQLSKEDTAAPFSGYEFVFTVPGPILGPPRWLTDDPTDPDRRFTRYVLSENKVHASEDPLYAAVKFRPDPPRWSATFRKVTITAIGAHLALAFASDRNTHNVLHERAYGTSSHEHRGGEMKQAIQEDAQATPPRKAAWSNNPLERAWRSS